MSCQEESARGLSFERSATYVPSPGRLCTKPSRASCAIARCTVTGLATNSALSSRTDGSNVPGASRATRLRNSVAMRTSALIELALEGLPFAEKLLSSFMSELSNDTAPIRITLRSIWRRFSGHFAGLGARSWRALFQPYCTCDARVGAGAGRTLGRRGPLGDRWRARRCWCSWYAASECRRGGSEVARAGCAGRGLRLSAV